MRLDAFRASFLASFFRPGVQFQISRKTTICKDFHLVKAPGKKQSTSDEFLVKPTREITIFLSKWMPLYAGFRLRFPGHSSDWSFPKAASNIAASYMVCLAHRWVHKRCWKSCSLTLHSFPHRSFETALTFPLLPFSAPGKNEECKAGIMEGVEQNPSKPRGCLKPCRPIENGLYFSEVDPNKLSTICKENILPPDFRIRETLRTWCLVLFLLGCPSKASNRHS